MEPTYDIVPSDWRAGGLGNGVHPLNTYDTDAHDLALLDAGIAAGSFGYGMADPRDAGQVNIVPDTAPETYDLAYDALAHERAELTPSRKSKFNLFRGEPDGSVRGLRNAAISLGYLPDREAREDGDGAEDLAHAEGGYGESWRIGWTERLPEIMQLSVDGPLEDMGLDASGHVPRAPVPDPIGGSADKSAHDPAGGQAASGQSSGGHGSGGNGAELQTDAALPRLSPHAHALLARMLDEDSEEAENFEFLSHDAPQAATHTDAATGAAIAEAEVHFIESQYAALHGALFDGDAPMDVHLHKEPPAEFHGHDDPTWRTWLHPLDDHGYS